MGKVKITAVPFKGTAEQEKKLKTKLNEVKGMPGAMMPALQAAQEIYEYLPVEAMKMVAETLDVSLETIFGVATFYSQFSLNPKGRNKVAVCLGTACYVKGAGELFDKFKELLRIDGGEMTADGEFSLDATRCIGCCGLAPVLTVNEEVYGKVVLSDVPGIVTKYKEE